MIEGYCYRRSYRSDEAIGLHVSTDAETFDVVVIRSGLEEVTHHVQRGIRGTKHTVPDDVVANGCGWPETVSISPGADWKSGFYKISLQGSDGSSSEACFILRPAEPTAAILWVIETNTWNAYNYYGGQSTYTDDSGSYSGGAAHVSFLRPLPKGFITLPDDHARLGDAGEPGVYVQYAEWSAANDVALWTGAASWSQWNRAFARWIESEKIEVDYAASEDLERFPDLLSSYRLMMSVGHDEYWSWGMRDAVESFIANGGNVAFLSGNTSYWQVRLEQDGQQMVAYKGRVEDDPVVGTADERYNTGIWSNRMTRRPENTMTGLSFTRGGYARVGFVSPLSSGGYTVYRSDHWALEGTGLSYGDQLGAKSYIIAYECDGCAFQMKNGLPVPTGEDGTPTNFEIIAIAPVALFTRENAFPGLYPEGELTDLELVSEQVEGRRDAETLAKYAHGHAVLGSYTSPGGGIVFNSGTTEWAFALVEPAVAQITRNVINRLSAERA
ncbi:N,N-dimethylformamidase beta subunit family domain-containing protein [Novosphingobium sp. B-7]|uniref:N,N-dimethylformamidase beta subunit family domain-containing protein n=1 Tax=Novosphingobium sp. B-7 TaxID=1298855 RepID=UPI0003B5F1A9|nr:N,N-dimethylformamidase beta subunit family domain-containing protein [Novosphingobium sp. B-7]